MNDRFRRSYRQLSEEEIALVGQIKEKAGELAVLLEQVGEPRTRALSHTKLEESVMWAVKGVTG
jgi:hypothetical protein